MPVFPIYLPLPLETRRVEAVNWKFTVEFKRIFVRKKWDTTGRRESVKLKGFDRGERGLLVALTVIVSFNIAVRR